MSRDRKTILFILPSPSGGGAERVLLTILQHIDRKAFEPILLLLSNEGALSKEIPNDIQTINLNSKHARYAIFKIIKTIYKISPHIVFSTLGYLNLIISIFIPLFSKKIHFIARESNTVSVKNRLERFPKLFDWLYKTFYNRFEIIIAQSNYMKNDLIQNYNITQDHIRVIYNPLDFDKVTALSLKEPVNYPVADKINLLSIGRLSYQKGFDRLLHTMTLLDKKFQLTILGEGLLENELKKSANDLNISDRVSFLGFQHNPYAYMRHADLLILPSRVEGLPNVVLEANACGLPVVAFDSPGGTSEIIQEGLNGFLVKDDDITALAEAITSAATNSFNIELMKDTIMTSYNIDNIIGEYETVFKNI